VRGKKKGTDRTVGLARLGITPSDVHPVLFQGATIMKRDVQKD
jgi:hypothetical protein